MHSLCQGMLRRIPSQPQLQTNAHRQNHEICRSHSVHGPEKSIVDEAYPGDIVGIPDTGNFKIGDTIVEGSRELHFKGLPSFSPEMFKYIENTDPMKSKQLEKGLNQLMDEGVAQLFTNQFNGRKSLAPLDNCNSKLYNTDCYTNMEPNATGSQYLSTKHVGLSRTTMQRWRPSKSANTSISQPTPKVETYSSPIQTTYCKWPNTTSLT